MLWPPPTEKMSWYDLKLSTMRQICIIKKQEMSHKTIYLQVVTAYVLIRGLLYETSVTIDIIQLGGATP